MPTKIKAYRTTRTIDRITNHVLVDACTPGNPREAYFESVRPVVEACVNGSL